MYDLRTSPRTAFSFRVVRPTLPVFLIAVDATAPTVPVKSASFDQAGGTGVANSRPDFGFGSKAESTIARNGSEFSVLYTTEWRIKSCIDVAREEVVVT